MREAHFSAEQAAAADGVALYRKRGCPRCNQTGYKGRIGIYEVMRISDRIRRMIAQRGSEASLRDAALAAGMISLGEDGLLKVKAGMTTPQELLRVVTEVHETRQVCPECGTRVAPDFTACPACGHRVGGGCPHCRRPIQPEWKFCPYCAKNTGAAPARKKPSRGIAPRRAVGELPAAKIAEFKKGS